MHLMSVGEFADYLTYDFEDDVVDIMRKNKISGSTFMKLSERQMERMIPAVGDLVQLREMQARLISLKEQVRIYCERS